MDNLESYLVLSLSVNFVLLFGIFSPDVVYFIHKKWFTWKVNKKCYNCHENYTLIDDNITDCKICGKLLYKKD